MIGYGKGNTAIGVAYIPTRKKPCLVVHDGNCITKYATFNNEETARQFMDIFADFVGCKRIDWTNDNDVPAGLCTAEEIWEVVTSSDS